MLERMKTMFDHLPNTIIQVKLNTMNYYIQKHIDTILQQYNFHLKEETFPVTWEDVLHIEHIEKKKTKNGIHLFFDCVTEDEKLANEIVRRYMDQFIHCLQSKNEYILPHFKEQIKKKNSEIFITYEFQRKEEKNE